MSYFLLYVSVSVGFFLFISIGIRPTSLDQIFIPVDEQMLWVKHVCVEFLVKTVEDFKTVFVHKLIITVDQDNDVISWAKLSMQFIIGSQIIQFFFVFDKSNVFVWVLSEMHFN